jgi:hypothetical protein
MRFNIDRMCKLAGVRTSSSSSSVLRESANYESKLVSTSFATEGADEEVSEDIPSEFDESRGDMDEMDHFDESRGDLGEMDHFDESRGDLDEMDHFDEDDDDDGNEMVHVDEATLVKELRRMKRIVTEAKSKSKLIAREVKSVLKDLNLNSGWVYGDRRPQRSKKGYLNHGSFLKGIGFK